MNPFQLEGKNIVITGASSGIGCHFAGVLSDAGANVILGARREEKIQARVDEISAAGGNATGLKLDVRDASSIASFLEAARETQVLGVQHALSEHRWNVGVDASHCVLREHATATARWPSLRL